jgi:hypothetical protein
VAETPFTIPEGSGNVILSYVRAKAAQWTIPEMVDRVRDGIAKLEAAARAIPKADLDRIPPGEEWSAIHCIRHVCEINLNTASRCFSAATGEERAPASLGAERETVLAAHGSQIDTYLSAINAAPETAGAGSAWLHPLLGELTWREWLLTLRVHSLGHADQLDAMLKR